MNWELVIDVLKALLTPCVAFFGTLIALKQVRIARTKLRLDLYEKRFVVFAAATRLMREVGSDVSVSGEALTAFWADTQHAPFLFDAEMVAYLQEIRKKALRLRAVNRRLERGDQISEGEQDRLINEDEELLKWFDVQLEQAQSRFAKYLQFADTL